MLSLLTFLAILLCPSLGSAGLVRSVEPAAGDGAPAAEAKPREITALPAGCEVRVDGRFTESCWQEGLWTDEFILSDSTGRRPQAQTVFKVRFDGGNLYIAVRANEPNMAHLKGFYGASHDDQAFNDDCVEVWLDPGDTRSAAYHQVYSVVGGTYDEVQHEEWRAEPPGATRRAVRRSDRGWDGSGEAAFIRSEGHWTCEMRLPVGDFGLDGIIPGSVWGFNLARERWAFPESGTAETSSLTGVFCWPLSAFARLRLGVPEVDVASLDFGSAGMGDNELRFACRDPQDKLPFVDVRLTIEGDETRSYRHSVQLRGSASQPVTIPYELRSAGDYILRLELLRPGSEVALFRKTLHRSLPSALSLRPRSHIAYRGEPWWVDVELLLGGVSQRRARLRVELLSPAGRITSRQMIGGLQPAFRLHLNLRRARMEGDYALRLTVVDDGADLGTASVPIRIIRPPR
jgi:hypothetical protein